MAKTELGALAFSRKGKRLRLILVTTKKTQRWICPKGQPEKGVDDHDVAVMEAFEEAGVTGEVMPEISREYVSHSGKRIRLFPLLVEKIHKQWPEKRQRRRCVCSLRQALGLISDEGLRQCVEKLLRDLWQSAAKV